MTVVKYGAGQIYSKELDDDEQDWVHKFEIELKIESKQASNAVWTNCPCGYDKQGFDN